MDEQHNDIVAYVLDNPEEAAQWIAELRAALQAYVDHARSYPTWGKPDSPFRLRMVAAEKALKMRGTP
jgi:plasmid stabilization system protein ParE